MKIVLTVHLSLYTIRYMTAVCQDKIERALDILNCNLALSMSKFQIMNQHQKALS